MAWPKKGAAFYVTTWDVQIVPLDEAGILLTKLAKQKQFIHSVTPTADGSQVCIVTSTRIYPKKKAAASEREDIFDGV